MSISKALIATALVAGVLGTSANAAFAHQTTQYVVRSTEACQIYARDYANWRAGHRGTRVATAGLFGAAAGGLIGQRFFGKPIAGAAIGAGAGIALQSYVRQPQWQAEFTNAYSACINGAPLSYPWMF